MRASLREWTSVPVLSMLSVAVIAVVAGILLFVDPFRSSAAPNPNQAVVDRQATFEVIGQVDTALQHILSYNYADPGATQTAAKQVLVGDAAHQFQVLFDALQKKANGQQLTLSAKVVQSGVYTLAGTNAELLVFLDQTSVRKSDGTTAVSPAQIQVSAVKQGGVWRINELHPH
jgi:Mce-associated membrane protein